MRAVLTHPLVSVVVAVALLVPASASSAPPPAPAAPRVDAALAKRRFEAGVSLGHEGRFPEACAAFADAAAASPLWALARFELARCVRLLGADIGVDPFAQLEVAEKDLQRPVLHIERARLLEDRGEVPQAFAAWMRALTMMPAEVRALEGAARTASLLAQRDGGASSAGIRTARERLEAWVQRQPGDVAAWVRLGELEEAAGRLPEAERAFIEAAVRSLDKRRGAALLGRFAVRAGSKSAADRARKIAEGR
jgi:tetratricopeptide (TPR) repeat protein